MTGTWRQGRAWVLWVLSFALMALILVATTMGTDRKGTSAVLDLTVVLAPFLAIAVVIERFWEAVFSWYESFALTTGRLLGGAATISRWVTAELEQAHRVVEAAVKALAHSESDSADYQERLDFLAQAEKRLQDARSRIEEALKAPEYVALKRAVTLFGSLVLGLFVAVLYELQLFSAAGLPMPAGLDILMTGLAIGSGPGPLHSLIGALQELRNAFAGIADLAKGTAIKKAAEALKSTPSMETRVETHTAAGVELQMHAEPAGGAVDVPPPEAGPARARSAGRDALQLLRQVRRELR